MFKKSYSVLLADDESLSRKLIGDRIAQMSNVSVAESLNSGISVQNFLKSHVVDILFTDIKMPFMDGLQLAGFMQTFAPSCPVVIISGYNDFEYARTAIKYGVKDYLLKPVLFKQIAEAVSKCCVEVDENRKKLLSPKKHDYQDLENQILQLSSDREKATHQIAQLDKIMNHGTVVVRIEIPESNDNERNDLAFIYKNILCDALSEYTILQLGYTKTRFDFLVIPPASENRRSMCAIPEYLDRILEQPVKWSELYTVSSVSELLDMYFSPKATENHYLISAACKYMEENIGESLTRDSVASHVWLSASYFSRLFKEVMGVGYNTYLTELRIKKAEELILQNNSISYIASTVGFRDARYFSTIFQEKTGYTPSEYRKASYEGKISKK